MSAREDGQYQGGDSPIDVREIFVRDAFTPAERATFALVIVSFLLLTWIPDPTSLWTVGGLVVCGILSVGALRLHDLFHPFAFVGLWRKWFLLMGPVWAMWTMWGIGLTAPSVMIDPGRATLIGASGWRPSSPIPGSGFATLLTLSGIYAVALCVSLIPKSRAFFLSLFPWLCLNVAVYALYGYGLRIFGAESIPGRPSVVAGESVFFAHHPLPATWLALALLWMSVMTGLGFLELRGHRKRSVERGFGPWYFSGAILLLGTSWFVTAPGASNLFFWFASTGIILLLVSHLFLSGRGGVYSWMFVGSAMIVAFLWIAWNALSSPHGAGSFERDAVWSMIAARPLWGWGIDSVPKLLPFFVSDFAEGAFDWNLVPGALHLLAEIGWITALVICLVPGFLVLHFFSGRVSVRVSQQILIAVFAVVCFALLAPAWSDPLVLFSWWLLLFAGIRWADVTRNEADKIDTEPYIILSSSLRKEQRAAQEARPESSESLSKTH